MTARPKSALHHNVTDPVPSDIQRYLKRPAEVVKGSLPAAAGAVAAAWAYTASNILAQPQWAVKLDQHMGIRSSVVCTLNISATPFHSGVLRLVWVPFGAAYIGSSSFRRSSRQELYTMPGITFNLSDTTQVSFKVPWLNTVPYLEYAGENLSVYDAYSPGEFRVVNLTDVTPPSGTVAPTFSMFVHHEDVVMIGPAPVSWSVVQPQGLMEDLHQTKAISTALAVGAKTAYALGKIPLLPSALNSIGWLLTRAAGTAALWGFAKPLQNERLMRITPVRGLYDSVATGSDPGSSLGLLHDPGVPVTSHAGTDVDEQSLRYICAVPGMVSDFTVTTQPAGTLVWACALSPSSMYYQDGRVLVPLRERIATFSTAPFPAVSMAPVCGASTLASYWQGSFDFEFFFSKTKFHTGRLAFVFVPGTHDGNYNVNLGVGSYKYPSYESTFSLDRQIVDVRNASGHKMHVPYVSPHPMQPQQGFYGFLCVYVVEPVRAPATVTPGVRMITVASSPDITFTGFTGVTWAPTTNANAVFAQSFLADSGEEITSLNQVAKRTCFRARAAGASGVQPFSQNLPVYTPTDIAPTACSLASVDLVDFCRAAFALERGGMIATATAANRRTRLVSTTFAASGATVDRLGFQALDASYAEEQDPGGVRIRAYVPRYTPYSAFKTDQGGTSNIGYIAHEYGRVPPLLSTTAFDQTGATNPFQSGRCVADDHMFSYFVGWPLMTRGSTF